MSTPNFENNQPNLFDELGEDNGIGQNPSTLPARNDREQRGRGIGVSGSARELADEVGDSVGVRSDAVGDAVSGGLGATAGTSNPGDSSTGASGADAASVAGEDGRFTEFPDASTDHGAGSGENVSTTAPDDNRGRAGLGAVAFEPGLDVHVPSSPRARAQANIEAIELVQKLDKLRRPATVEEQQVLARFSSWGAVPEIFEYRPGWEDLQERLENLLTAEQFAAASRTTMNAHYTDPRIASAMWSALEHAGFEGGTVLEPGCGSGNFIGQSPDHARMVGVELDEVSAKVASYLYPDATVRAEGFQKTFIPNNGLSAVIGNVPFGDFWVYDSADNREQLRIHNYFIHKSMKHLPAGGYGVFITSSGTLDAKGTKHREVIAEHSDLVGAVRLPSGAFSRVAGTGVQTDILIFRRREEGQPLSPGEYARWVAGHTVTGEIDGESVEVSTSRYFQDNPQFVMGDVSLVESGFPVRPMLKVSSDDSMQELAARVERALKHHVDAARDAMGYAPAIDPSVSLEALDAGGYVDSSTQVDESVFVGTLRTVATSRTVQVLGEDRVWRNFSVAARGKKTANEELYRLVELKECVRSAVDARGDQSAVLEQLERLNSLYDAYVQQYGYINRFTVVSGKVPSAAQQERAVAKELKRWQDTHRELSAAERSQLSPDEQLLAEWKAEAETPLPDVKRQDHLRALRSDPDFGKLVALENFHEAEQVATKSEYFNPQMYHSRMGERTADSPADALAISLDETRSVSLERIGELLNVDEATAREQLGTLVFTDPSTGELVPAVKYLSGDVRQKYAEAVLAAADDEQFAVNVQELEKILPEWVGLNQIAVQPGVQFVSPSEYQQFAREVLGVDMDIKRLDDNSGWSVPNVSKSKISTAVQFEFGTSRRSPVDLFQKLMNNRAIIVHDTVVENGTKKQVVNESATRHARAKAQLLKERFSLWVGLDAGRAEAVERRFNEMFNSYVQPDYSSLGAGLALDGVSASFTPHPYQREAVARITHEPAVLLDHVVGAGKTGSMIMGAMELRRTGVANKPWMVVPNHLTDQISREFAQWYPTSKVLTIPTGISRDERRRYAAMSAGGDWDAVICPQSVFSQIGVSPRRQREWIEQEIEALREARGDVDSTDKVRVKNMEAAIARLEARLEKILDSKVSGITFEETGCDYLFVDEAHHYKNLPRTSDFRELSCVGSNKALDMDFILRTLRDLKVEELKAHGVYNGQQPSVVTFATGTPVANSLAEMWVMAHYLRPDITEKMGINTIDAFGSAFTKAESSVEVKPSGVGFQIVNRISKFTNVEQLMQLSAIYTSRVSREQIPAQLPEVVSGGIRAVEREASVEVKQYMEGLVRQLENPGANDYVIEILGRARKVALDPRTVGLPKDADGGRAHMVAQEVMRIEEKYQDAVYKDVLGNDSPVTGGLQLLFCDQGTPSGVGFNMYKAIKDELVELGMDEFKIAFIHDVRTDSERGELFARARAGEISVLIGSTEKMGTGMNVQQRVTAVHHVDIPWRPADLEQREGRAIRQGNQNAQVEILSHITVGTFDAYNWQTLVNKATMLDQIRNHKAGHEVDDLGAMTQNYQELLAVASGNPKVSQWFEVSMASHELLNLKRSEEMYVNDLKYRLSTTSLRAESARESMQSLGRAIAITPYASDAFVVGSDAFETRGDDAGFALTRALRAASVNAAADGRTRVGVGRIGNVVFTARRDASSWKESLVIEFAHAGSGELIRGVSESVKVADLMNGQVSGRGLAQRIWNRAFSFGERFAELESTVASLEAERDNLQKIVDATGDGFERQEELDALLLERDALAEELGISADDPTGDTEVVDYLDDEQYQLVTGSEYSSVDSYSSLRSGDVIEVRKTTGHEFASGFYIVDVQWNAETRVREVRLRPESEEKGNELEGLMHHNVKFSLVKRPVDALNAWELAVFQAPETDQVQAPVKSSAVFEDLGADAVVSVPVFETDERGGKKLDEQGHEVMSVVTGSVVSWENTKYGYGLLVVLRDEQGNENAYEIAGRPRYSSSTVPAFIVRDAFDAQELERQREAQQAAVVADRAMLKANRLYPGDRLVHDVQDIAEAGWMVEHARTMYMSWTYFADPVTGQKYKNHRDISDFVGEIVTGRDLSDEEMQELFADARESITVGGLRPGDVVDGQKLDAKNGLAGDVRIVSLDSNGNSSEIEYRPVGAERWEEPLSVTRRNSTEVGSLNARRFGALTRAERVILSVPSATEVPLGDLANDELAGSYALVSDIELDSVPGQKLETVVKVVSGRKSMDRALYSNGGSMPFLNLEVELNGETGRVRRAHYEGFSAVLLPEGLPESGIDYTGTSLVAEADSTAVVEVNDFDAGIVSMTVIERDAVVPDVIDGEVITEAEEGEITPVHEELGLTDDEPHVAQQQESESNYTLDDGVLRVDGLSGQQVQELTESLATVNEDGEVVSATAGADDAQVRGFARAAFALEGIEGVVSRASVSELLTGDTIAITADDGALSYPDQIEDLARQKLAGIDGADFDGSIVGIVLSTDSRSVELGLELDEQSVQVRVVPTAADQRFAVVDTVQAIEATQHLNADAQLQESVRRFASVQGDQVQVGSRVSASQVPSWDAYSGAGTLVSVDDALVLSNRASDAGQVLRLWEGEQLVEVLVPEEKILYLDALATDSSTEQAGELAREHAEVVLDVVGSPAVGERVAIIGEDSVTGDQIENTGVVVSEPLVDGDHRTIIPVRTDAGDEVGLVAAESILRAQLKQAPDSEPKYSSTVPNGTVERNAFDGVPFVDENPQVLVSEPRGVSEHQVLSAAQVRVGDRVQVAGASPLPVYRTHVLNESMVQLTVLREDGLASAAFPLEQAVNVARYPESDSVGQHWFTQDIARVRSGDVIGFQGESFEVVHTARTVDAVKVSALDATDTVVDFSVAPTTQVGVKTPLCSEDRMGVRGDAASMNVASLSHGDVIATKKGAAVVNSVDVDAQSDAVRVNFQFLGRTSFSPMHTLEKTGADTVMVYAQSQQPAVAQEQTVNREAEVHRGPDVSSSPDYQGPEMN